MTKTQKVVAISGAIILALAGYTALVINQTRTEMQSEIEKTETLKHDTLLYLTEEHPKEEIESTLISAFKQMDKEDNTEIVDALIYGTYNAAASVMMSDEETNVLYNIMDDNRNFDLSKIEDEEMRSGIEKLVEQNIIPTYVNGSMFYDVDYGYFADTYGEYLNDDYCDLLKFYHEEKKADYVDAANSTLLTDVVTKRLDELSEMGKKYINSDLLPILEQCYRFYECIYLGAYSQDYIFTDDARLKEDIMSSYKEYVQVCENESLTKFLTELIKEYEEVDFVRTVPIMEKIRDYCELNTESAASPSDAIESTAVDLTELTGITADDFESEN